jgi:hypothetical protein
MKVVIHRSQIGGEELRQPRRLGDVIGAGALTLAHLGGDHPSCIRVDVNPLDLSRDRVDDSRRTAASSDAACAFAVHQCRRPYSRLRVCRV